MNQRLALLILADIYGDEDCTHDHKCENCGTIWTHTEAMAGSVKAHSCPHCRRLQWSRHYGDES